MLRNSLTLQQTFKRFVSTRSGPWTYSAIYTETGDPAQVVRLARHQLPSPQPTSVLVRMLASPVNPSDLNQIEGVYPVKGKQHKLRLEDREITGCVGGNEGLAEVMEIGNSVDKVRVGDWVIPKFGGEFGTWTTHAMAEEDGVEIIPKEWRSDKVDPLVAATMKVNASTAYRMLEDFVELQRGDWVIQNAANSGVGRALAQLARVRGLRTINVVREHKDDPGRFDRVAKQLKALGADKVVRDTELASQTFKQWAKALDKPVRLGLNCVGGRMTAAMAKYLSAGGTLVTYGGMSRQPVTLPTSLLLFKDIRARGFWMNQWYQRPENQQLKTEMWRDILRMAERGQLVVPQNVRQVEWATAIGENEAKVRSALTWSSNDAKSVFVF